MGVTLHAVVEIDVGEYPGYPRWQIVSEWWFNKDSELISWVYDGAQIGWPDGETLRDPDHEFDDEGRQWCDLATLLAPQKNPFFCGEVGGEEPEWLTPPTGERFGSLIASLKSFHERSIDARVLWWRG